MNMMISVPPERHAQLLTLANIEDSTIADVLADFVRQAIYDGRLADKVPGWTIERAGDVIMLAHPYSGIDKRLTPAEAKNLADRLEAMCRPAGSPNAAVLDLDINLEVTRRGAAVKIVDIDLGATYTFARSIAADIAELLRKAAA